MIIVKRQLNSIRHCRTVQMMIMIMMLVLWMKNKRNKNKLKTFTIIDGRKRNVQLNKNIKRSGRISNQKERKMILFFLFCLVITFEKIGNDNN